ncbi:Predicted choloylglycine hydrolase [Loktanella sp. DSM 29012]|uniref:C45 family autoproteolytic acyltransferase/hydolase n=1 Tax=Loktanella sp. DSM 29012 TaxID=1881056 RepID=UPI0008D65C60|nr:C45 family peptidase [Loktanella sp. DSM 29012]SEQ55666.1 Predicted choloylglycine hydrolase [Loktanella sp. DSM 29012]
MTLTFDAVSEPTPGPKWRARWERSWPAYEAWFVARGGDNGPTASESRAALKQHMPELVPTYDRLAELAGGTDRAKQFLSTWCPPTYLGGCSLAAVADAEDVRLVRNYDLSPTLNEGLLLRTEWTGRAVMGMVEFLWGLSDGINQAGLSIALAYGGRSESAEGFGITTILRYVLETCDTVDQALTVLHRVPSHMAYNVVLADACGATASVELSPGGGAKVMDKAIATNHQSGATRADRPDFTKTEERHAHLSGLQTPARDLAKSFLAAPLIQTRYGEGFGTLFTADYDPKARTLALTIAGDRWEQSLGGFAEGQRTANYASGALTAATDATGVRAGIDWAAAVRVDWSRVGRDYAEGNGRSVEDYIAEYA